MSDDRTDKRLAAEPAAAEPAAAEPAAAEPAAAEPADLDTGVAHPARVYDYWLGGTNNFAVDRETAERVIAARPTVVRDIRANRAFLCRAVAHLTAQAGVKQFLDIGAGIPASPNVHEVAQEITSSARIVYVDNDPTVLAHARALLCWVRGPGPGVAARGTCP